VLTILISAVSATYLFMTDVNLVQPKKSDNTMNNIVSEEPIGENIQTNAPAIEIESQKIVTKQKDDAGSAAEGTKNEICTTFEIQNNKNDVCLSGAPTAYDAMKKLILDKKITAQMKEFSGLGFFVEEINGTKNNPQTNEYWIYYINGASAQVGISQYKIKNNDLITWKYEKAKF
jgi:hypothetical protein